MVQHPPRAQRRPLGKLPLLWLWLPRLLLWVVRPLLPVVLLPRLLLLLLLLWVLPASVAGGRRPAPLGRGGEARRGVGGPAPWRGPPRRDRRGASAAPAAAAASAASVSGKLSPRPAHVADGGPPAEGDAVADVAEVNAPGVSSASVVSDGVPAVGMDGDVVGVATGGVPSGEGAQAMSGVPTDEPAPPPRDGGTPSGVPCGGGVAGIAPAVEHDEATDDDRSPGDAHSMGAHAPPLGMVRGVTGGLPAAAPAVGRL